jgi:hypothetical protein
MVEGDSARTTVIPGLGSTHPEVIDAEALRQRPEFIPGTTVRLCPTEKSSRLESMSAIESSADQICS